MISEGMAALSFGVLWRRHQLLPASGEEIIPVLLCESAHGARMRVRVQRGAIPLLLPLLSSLQGDARGAALQVFGGHGWIAVRLRTWCPSSASTHGMPWPAETVFLYDPHELLGNNRPRTGPRPGTSRTCTCQSRAGRSTFQ